MSKGSDGIPGSTELTNGALEVALAIDEAVGEDWQRLKRSDLSAEERAEIERRVDGAIRQSTVGLLAAAMDLTEKAQGLNTQRSAEDAAKGGLSSPLLGRVLADVRVFSSAFSSCCRGMSRDAAVIGRIAVQDAKRSETARFLKHFAGDGKRSLAERARTWCFNASLATRMAADRTQQMAQSFSRFFSSKAKVVRHGPPTAFPLHLKAASILAAWATVMGTLTYHAEMKSAAEGAIDYASAGYEQAVTTGTDMLSGAGSVGERIASAGDALEDGYTTVKMRLGEVVDGVTSPESYPWADEKVEAVVATVNATFGSSEASLHALEGHDEPEAGPRKPSGAPTVAEVAARAAAATVDARAGTATPELQGPSSQFLEEARRRILVQVGDPDTATELVANHLRGFETVAEQCAARGKSSCRVTIEAGRSSIVLDTKDWFAIYDGGHLAFGEQRGEVLVAPDVSQDDDLQPGVR